MKTRYQTVSIFAAFLCMGFVASLFLIYSFIVMPGLATIGDTAFVAAFQGLETRFQNPENFPGYKSVGFGNIPALIAFPGAIFFSLLAAILNWKESYNKWVIGAFLLFGIGMITTVMYNLPSNEAIFAAGDPSLIDTAIVRKEFDEVAWINWNHFRGATSILATCCLMVALYRSIKSK